MIAASSEMSKAGLIPATGENNVAARLEIPGAQKKLGLGEDLPSIPSPFKKRLE